METADVNVVWQWRNDGWLFNRTLADFAQTPESPHGGMSRECDSTTTILIGPDRWRFADDVIMALRLLSRGSIVRFHGSASISAVPAVGSISSRRNATAMAVPTPRPIDEFKGSILVSLRSTPSDLKSANMEIGKSLLAKSRSFI